MFVSGVLICQRVYLFVIRGLAIIMDVRVNRAWLPHKGSGYKASKQVFQIYQLAGGVTILEA
jgi:hypothetical protein